MHDTRSILFLTPCFLQYRLHKQVRGVEVFDLLLVRQLVELGHRVTVAADSSWRERFSERLAGATPEFVYTPSLRKLWLNALVAERALRGRRFDALIVGNNARGLLPTVKRLQRRAAADRTVLIAHRPPRPDYVKAARGMSMDVTAVNSAIAADFEGVVNGRVETRYGIPNAELFTPRERAAAPDEPVRFLMLGRLDTQLKRVDRALAALERLPDDVRRRIELHLASYPDPPRDLPPGVTAHPWMTPAEVAALVRKMDVFLGLSDHETFSQAMVQAMLCACACIVNTVPAYVEKLDAGGGVIVRTDDELVDAMRRITLDAEWQRRLGAEARATALARYVWDSRRFVEEMVFAESPSVER